VVIYGVAASFCAMALVVAVSRSAALGAALVMVEVVVVFLMRNLGFRGRREFFPPQQRQQFCHSFIPAHSDERDGEKPRHGVVV